MTEEDLATRLREGLRQRQNDSLFVPDSEGPLVKPEPWKPDTPPPRTCSTGKTVFNTVRQARDCLERIHRRVENGDNSRDYIPLYVAPRCNKCGGFHVTSKQPRQTRDNNRHEPRTHRG